MEKRSSIWLQGLKGFSGTTRQATLVYVRAFGPLVSARAVPLRSSEEGPKPYSQSKNPGRMLQRVFRPQFS